MIDREENEIDQLEYLKTVVAVQDQLLMETKITIQDMWRVLDSAQNPHLFGASRSAWKNDRDRALENLKRLEVRIRARTR